MDNDLSIDIHSRFQVVQRLGSGAIGTVYKAIDLELNGQVVALKVLHDHLLSDERTLQRFRNEVVLSREVVHPNVVRIFDLATGADGRQLIVMEFVDGCTLREHLEQNPHGFSSDEVVRLVTEICDGLQAAHDRGIVHRDLKPDNILITSHGSVKIADLGLARRLDDGHGLTRTGESLGTAYYMAPEQVKGSDATELADVYALGIITYELLTGRRPFDGTSYFSVINGHLNERIGDPRAIVPAIPSWWSRVLRRATAKNPRLRQKSARTLATEIKAETNRKGLTRAIYEAWSRVPEASPLIKLPFNLFLLTLLLVALIAIPTRLLAERRSTRVAALAKVIRFEESTGIPLQPIRFLLRYSRDFSRNDAPIYISRDDDLSLELALQLGHDANKPLADGKQQLQYAIESIAPKSAMVLLDYGADPNRIEAGREPPLTAAVISGLPHVVRKLVDKGAKLDAVDGQDNTALHYAAGMGSLYALEFLLSKGGKPNEHNTGGNTPYHLAAVLPYCIDCPAWVREESVRLIAKHGGNPEERNLLGASVREMAEPLGIKLPPTSGLTPK